jgi:phenylalanyl-tRNA synthetase beta chain
VLALDRAAELLTELADGQVSRGVIDERPHPLARTAIPLRAQRVAALLGSVVEDAEIARCLRTLGATVQRERRGTWRVTVPTHRSDLTQEADLVEELARLRGYDTIPTLLPKAELRGAGWDKEGFWSRRVRTCLVAQGLAEMINLSFTSARFNELFPGLVPESSAILIVNPLSTEDAELRISLLSNLIRALQYNVRQGARGVAAFELGKVFYTKGISLLADHKQEQINLSGVLLGELPVIGLGLKSQSADFTDLKGIVEALCQELHCETQTRWVRAGEISFLHPGKSAALTVSDTIIGVAGALHPAHCAELGLSDTLWIFELDFTSLLDYAHAVTRYQPLPRFPVVVRDLAIVAHEELPAQAVIEAVSELAHPLIMDVRLFDLYRGDAIPAKKKSLAYSISYRAPDRTLTAVEVNSVHAQVVAHVVQTLEVEVRT